MNHLVYELMMDIRGDLIRHIVGAAADISDQDALRCVAHSVVKTGSYRS
jgi:hypothetical protein